MKPHTFALLPGLCLTMQIAAAEPILPATDEAEPLVVRITAPAQDLEPRDSFFLELARQSLEAALPENALKLDYRPEPMRLPQQRMLRELRLGEQIDLTWTMTSSDREANLLPVRIPLLQGLAGYRALVIREESQTRFDSIESLESFDGLVGGQLQDWPDIEILRANGLEQISALTVEQLYQMLRAGRIDYLPRGITEIAVERGIYNFEGLHILHSPILRYPAPIYFFVTPQRPELADILQDGLEQLHQSGQLQQLRQTHPNTAPWFNDPTLWQDRHFIDLENAELNDLTPLDQADLWLNPHGDQHWPTLSNASER